MIFTRTLARAADVAMDRTVVPGFSKIGWAARRALPGWPADPPRLDGRTVLVTGATGGLGLAAAQGFARLGATVVLLGRNAEKLAAAQPQVPGSTTALCDVSSQASLRSFCDTFLAEHDRLDVLVNNAGVLPAERAVTDEGIELTLATNVLAGFVLTDRLQPLLEAAHGRVVNVSSGGMYGQRLDVAKLESEEPYSGVAAYARTKRAQVVLSDLWAERLRECVGVHAMHPGWAATPGITDSLATFATVMKPVLRTAAQGADTIVWLGATDTDLGLGGFWQDRRRRPEHITPFTRGGDAQADDLWALCERLTA